MPGSSTPSFATAHGPSASEEETRAWILQAQDGSSEAFGQLYRTHGDTVFRYVYYRVSTKALAEDLTSETFLRALRRIETFRWQGGGFCAWLVTIARNLIADHFKSSRHRMEVSTGEMFDCDEVEASPEESVLASLSDQALWEVLQHLNDHQRRCLVLRFWNGLSVLEVADAMGVSEGAVKTLLYRGVRTLARLLKAQSDLAGGWSR